MNNQEIAKLIIEETIDPLLEYTIEGKLYSNLEQQITLILEDTKLE